MFGVAEKSTETAPVAPFRFIKRWEEGIERRAAARPAGWLACVLMVAIAINLGSKFPLYVDASQPAAATFATFPHTPYGAAVSWWLDHPFRPVPAEGFFPPETRHEAGVVGSISHFDKLTFRATLPLLNGVFHGGFWTLVVANHLAVLATCLLLYGIIWRQTGDPVGATLFVWAYAATWAGGWGFNDMVCGDAVAIALMVAALAVRRSWAVTLLVIAAGFTDERAIMATPLLALFRHWSAQPPLAAAGQPAGRGGWGTCWPVVAGVGGYAALRLSISAVWGVSSGTSMLGGIEILRFHCFVSFPGQIFGVFEFLWIFPLGLLAALLGTPGGLRRQGLLFALGLGGAIAPALMVWDIERSLCYLLPGVLLAVCFFPGGPVKSRRLLWVVFGASLVWFQISDSILRYVLL